jgi:hypothetical protein
MDDRFEAVVETDGRVRLMQEIHLNTGSTVFVSVPETAFGRAPSGPTAVATESQPPEDDDGWGNLRDRSRLDPFSLL